MRRPLRLLATLSALGFAAPGAALVGDADGVVLEAQDPEALRRRAEQLLGRPISNTEILQWLRQSDLTPEEIRNALEARGFPREAADAYLEVLEGRAASVGEGADPTALISILGGMTPEGLPQAEGGLGAVPSPRAARGDTAEMPAGPPIFGRDLFDRATSQFIPVTTGPVPPDYRLGPGDELVLALTGDVEAAYELPVTREGWILIPDVGRVLVNGLTLDELEDVLFRRLGDVYSGIGPEGQATTFFNVSLGDLRTTQVYVMGEVEEPGAYTLSSMATALTALYWAGGPTTAGSFRRARVNRGGETVREIDLYDYLLGGDASQDVRLEQGDIVFVPTAGERVEVDGAVTRPALYELAEGETLRDAIEFAGGFQPYADLRRVQIERVLPPDEREPGRSRAVVDVSLAGLEDAAAVPLRNGDRVTVFAVLETTRNQIALTGAVWRPGTYGAEPGLRLWDLIERAGGLLPDVYEGRAQIQRLDESEYRRRLIPVSLERDADGNPVENPPLEGMDQVFVYAKRNLRETRVVSIGGWVREPGVYPYADGMSVRDLILKAGGLRPGAFLGHAEVSRVVFSQAHTDTLTRSFRVPLDSTYVELSALPEGGGAAASDFGLRDLDAVFVRKAPGFDPQETVVVTGQVLLPGPYALETRGERLSDIIERAGGLTPEAYPEALQLWRADPRLDPDTLTAIELAGRAAFARDTAGRDTARARDTIALDRMPADDSAAAGVLGAELTDASAADERLRALRRPIPRIRVGVDFPEALRDAEGRQNVLIEPNDSIFVPRYIPTVAVQGAVGMPTRVLYREGANLGYYLDQAGGYAESADKSRTRVRYANGEVRTRGGKFLFFGGRVPDPDPGSVITVPTEPDRGGGFRVGEFVGIFTSLVTATATIIIAISR